MSKKPQPEHLKLAQTRQSEKRKIPAKPKLTKEQLWQRESERFRAAGLTKNSTKREMIDVLLADDPQYQDYIQKVRKREKNSAEFQKAYAKDFNTAYAILQSENKSIPRMQPFTTGGPMKVSYLRYCGAGKKIEYNERTGTWTCEKDSASEKSERFKSNFGDVTKTSLRERSLTDLTEMARDYGLSFTKYAPSKDTSITKEDRAKMNASARNKKKTELIKLISEYVNSKRKDIYSKRKTQEDKKKEQSKKRRAEKRSTEPKTKKQRSD